MSVTPPSDISLPIDAPLVVDDLHSAHWDTTVDVLVVGLGAAGAATALTAKEQGADVLVIDRFDSGGATARSGGVVYAGGGTSQQIEAGYEDTPENMYNYLRHEVGDAVKPETLRRFCEASVDLIDWLQSLGAEFRSYPKPPKTSYPKDGVYLYYSGNEAIAGFKDDATPAPRGHRTVDQGLSGHRLFRVLRGAVEQANIPVWSLAAARRLIVSELGEVYGAEVWRLDAQSTEGQRFAKLSARAEQVHNFAPRLADYWRRKARAIEVAHAKPVRVRAASGVSLTTGGFIFNRSMMADHAPKYMSNMRLGTAGCDGSGIRLGQSVGGDIGHMHKVSAWRFINPPTPWVEGMVVNQKGERFCNEASYGARLGVVMCEEQGGRAWLILDKNQRRRAYKEALTGGLWMFQSAPALLLMLFSARAKSLARLAAKLGMPANKLIETQAAYNQAASGAAIDHLGKEAPALQACGAPPYVGVNISVTNPGFPCPAITLGGLRVDELTGQVLNQQGIAISGLYAAGRAAIGIASNGYVSGLSLADCLWSGRRAGMSLGSAEV